MKVCEVCGGMGCRPTDCLLCAACEGTGAICLGHESAGRYEDMKRAARAKAARLGWLEDVWEGQWPEPVRKVRRVVTIEDRELVAIMNGARR